jgi:CRP-like cAMP-binding protein
MDPGMEIQGIKGERWPARELGARREPLRCGNKLLARLPDTELARFLPHFERVEIAARQVLHHRNLPMDYVHFVEAGLISVMAKMSEQSWVEVWLIGSDGTTGIAVALGDHHPQHRRVVQIGGSALRIATPALRRLLSDSKPLRDVLLKYVQIVLLQASQSGACNAQHAVRQRLARWLLLARDSVGSSRLPLPQQVLGRLIGVRRATISDCLRDIEASGAVRTTRRLVEITDADALEALACDCYRTIKRERQRLLGY